MNKILASLLVAGVSCGGIQSASAGKNLEVEDNSTWKKAPIKSIFKHHKNMYEKGYRPGTPAKKHSVQFRLATEKAKNDPENFLIGNDGTSWRKGFKPSAPVNLIPTPEFQTGEGVVGRENKNLEKARIKREMPTIIVTFHG